jgi:putative ABC transport system ATP-binding protein
VLADEPTGALDSANGETIARLLRIACSGQRGVVLATHDAELARWADRIVHLRDGRLSTGGDPEPLVPPAAAGSDRR